MVVYWAKLLPKVVQKGITQYLLMSVGQEIPSVCLQIVQADRLKSTYLQNTYGHSRPSLSPFLFPTYTPVDQALQQATGCRSYAHTPPIQLKTTVSNA